MHSILYRLYARSWGKKPIAPLEGTDLNNLINNIPEDIGAFRTCITFISLMLRNVRKIQCKSFSLGEYFNRHISPCHNQTFLADLHLVHGAPLQLILGKQAFHLRLGASLLRYHSHEASTAGAAKRLKREYDFVFV